MEKIIHAQFAQPHLTLSALVTVRLRPYSRQWNLKTHFEYLDSILARRIVVERSFFAFHSQQQFAKDKSTQSSVGFGYHFGHYT